MPDNHNNHLELAEPFNAKPSDTRDPRLLTLGFLVIDDDPFEQKLISTVLKKLGCQNIESAGGGQAALDRLSSNVVASDNEIDIAICDLKMPDIDGLEFVRRISQFDNPPAIIFASGADNSICRAAEQIGSQLGIRVLGSVSKPATAERFFEHISSFFNVAQKYSPLGGISNKPLSQEEAITGLENACIEMYYQPKISVKTGEISGFESLARWRDEDRGMLGPGAFIPTIERHGLMDTLTKVVIERTLLDLSQWNNQYPHLRTSINIAAENLSNLELPNLVVNTAKSLSINPNRITLEVTESGVASDVTTAMEILTRFRLNDIRLSIDDFGTGYASLDKLKDLPFSELKIDRGFVQGAATNESAMALLQFACELGKKLGLYIVAEGVETQQQWDLVEELGCDSVQGFFISKPIPKLEVPNWIERWNPQRSQAAASP